MELSFRTKRLRTLCSDSDVAVSLLGEPTADVLRTRLADLRAVTYLAELPAGRPVVVEGNPPQLRFDLRVGWLLLMGVGHLNIPRTREGHLDLTRVRRAQVQEISQ
jgi:hypothetical protein